MSIFILKSNILMQVYGASSWQRCSNRGIRPSWQLPNGHVSMSAWLVVHGNKCMKEVCQGGDVERKGNISRRE